MPTDFNYANLRPLDVFCTSASTLTGRVIRFMTASLKHRNPVLEFSRQRIANHCAIVIRLDKKLWVAEMVDDGLKINSCRTYLNNRKEKIVAVRRNKKFRIDRIADEANEYIIDLCRNTVDYDYRMILQYIGLGHSEAKKYYCSELCEIVANRYMTTWDEWQLKRPAPNDRISPVEIQLGVAEYADSINLADVYI